MMCLHTVKRLQLLLFDIGNSIYQYAYRIQNMYSCTVLNNL